VRGAAAARPSIPSQPCPLAHSRPAAELGR
jgi:hypothetical protein